MIDRALMYSAARKQSRVFVQQVAGALKDGKLDEAVAIAEPQQEEPYRQGRCHGPQRISIRFAAGE